MAFHIACPITCRRICDCDLGFGDGLRGWKAREEFLDEIERLEEFLKDPWSLKIGGEGEAEEMTVQVRVPRVVRKEDDGEERERRAALQRQAAAASVAAEDYARRLEIGAEDLDLMGETPHSHAREDLGSSNVKVICRICFSGENEGSTRALKMLSCKTCNKKYHRSCLKSWADHRDLFHWSSWDCPSCRICEVCRSTGDPSKLMFCRRCDGAYHCYCQQPPHKNIGHGPYCCSKHTKCHSCGSTVPGNGPSTRWFLGYTCCDACGRLFVKGNYCPVCLKVYRDSEMTPMVCCDICERWIHCECDGISDEKYQQFQVDQNLHYTCAACRGDCYQVKDTDDSVRELWKRKDETDRKLIASLRASAGLPSQEDISPYSDNELSSPAIINDYGRSLKFSVKGSSDKFITNSKECVNTVSNKTPMKKSLKFVGNVEASYQKLEKQNEEISLVGMFRPDGSESKQIENNKYSSINEFGRNNVDRVKSENLHYKGSTAKTECKNETIKGTKLVIHLGPKNINVSSSPRSETSSCHREQDLAISYGNEDTSHPTKDAENHIHEGQIGHIRWNVKGHNKYPSFTLGAKPDDKNLRRSSKHGDKEGKVTKLGKISDAPRENNGTFSPAIAAKAVGEFRSDSDEDIVLLKKKQPTSSSLNIQNDIGHHTSRLKFVSSSASTDTRPLLKLKFKNPYFEEQKSSWASRGEEENPVKGQRSKRKRPSTLEKIDAGGTREEDSPAAHHHPKNPLTEQEMDANWILQKLGKDAVGKRVEVYQSSDDSWRKGVVSDVTIKGGGTSSFLLVHLDDGKSTTLDLKKQAVRFASQKTYKRAKTRL